MKNIVRKTQVKCPAHEDSHQSWKKVRAKEKKRRETLKTASKQVIYKNAYLYLPLFFDFATKFFAI